MMITDDRSTRMDRTTQARALPMLYTGLALTILASLAPIVDLGAGGWLAAHIRHGYPGYTNAEVHAAATTWIAVLASLGVLGAAGWITTIAVVRRGRRWAAPVATGLFVVGALAALAAALTPDTSGEVGLAPSLGAIGLLPVLAGAVAVALLWRRR